MKIPVTTAALANLRHWQAGQGERIKANRPPEIYRACEFVARGLAPIRDPLVLEPLELANAAKAAVTQERSRLHPGPVEKVSADVFWTQISSIAERWGIKTTREQWERKSKTDERKAA